MLLTGSGVMDNILATNSNLTAYFGKVAQALSWSFPNSLIFLGEQNNDKEDVSRYRSISFVRGFHNGSRNLDHCIDNHSCKKLNIHEALTGVQTYERPDQTGPNNADRKETLRWTSDRVV